MSQRNLKFSPLSFLIPYSHLRAPSQLQLCSFKPSCYDEFLAFWYTLYNYIIISQRSFLICSSNPPWESYALIIFSIRFPKQVLFVLSYTQPHNIYNILFQFFFYYHSYNMCMFSFHLNKRLCIVIFKFSRFSPIHSVSCKHAILIPFQSYYALIPSHVLNMFIYSTSTI